MAAADNIYLSLKICHMYYIEKKSQKEISAELDISRPQISRILAAAWNKNLISVKINNPFENEMRLERELIMRYQLRDALVLKINETNHLSRVEKFGQLAAVNLDSYIADNDSVGILSGFTIGSLIHGITTFNRKNLEIVPLIGNVGALNTEYQANYLARNLASLSGGRNFSFNAPAKLIDIQSKEILKSEPDIASVLELGSKCDVVLFEINGINHPSGSILLRNLSVKDIELLMKLGATASIGISFLDNFGNLIPSEISDLLLGKTIDEMKNAKKIAAAIGKNNVDAIKSAFMGKYVDIFMTDYDTAKALLE